MLLDIIVNQQNYVVGYMDGEPTENAIEVPDTFKEENFLRYKFVNGKLETMTDEEFDKEYPNYYTANQQNIQEENFLKEQRTMLLQTLSDEKAVEYALLYDEWKPNQLYSNNEIVRYGDKLYRCISKARHMSIESWTPYSASSLWTEISDPREEYPEFIQPTGAHNAYSIGSKITFNNIHYISEIENNVWSPIDFPRGWRKISSVEEVNNTYPDFIQPTGAHDAYKKGDRITFQNKRYESVIDDNVYSPENYPAGWKLVE